MVMIQRARLAHVGWDDDLVIESRDEPPPEPAGNEVRIEVEACAVCYRDCIDRAGRYKAIQLPVTPGHEAVGRITAVGPAVRDWAVGDRVGTLHRDFCGGCVSCAEGNTSLCERAAALLGLAVDGGYASHLLAPERCFFRIPEAVPAVEAAVLYCTFGTSYRALKRCGRVKSGQHVLITGANGGVGSAAIQVAGRLGARVTAVVRDERHAEYVTALGARDAIVDAGDRFHKHLGGGPADVVLECVGEPTFNASLRSLCPGGRLVVVGNVVEDRVAVNLGYVITRGLEVIGSSGATRLDMQELLTLHGQHPFTIPIHAQMDVAQADQAQRLVRGGGLHGRIVLVPTRH
jgi:D-arabinose 1-dehydrogenase-like Zn-dependent alcohol dehydrogenase